MDDRSEYSFSRFAFSKGGVKELNLTSGKLRDLLLKDEDNESIYCRTLLFATDNELWIGTEIVH